MAASRGRDARRPHPLLRDIHASAFWVLMLAILVLGVVILSPTVHLYVTQQNQIAALRSAVGGEQHRLDTTRAQAARWNDPSYVRSEARERLYFVMPGETSFLVIDDLPHATKRGAGAKVQKNVQTAKGDWASTLFASVVSAGVTSGASPR
ncbi:MAG TPA: septum formation initiator family protein [Microbacteriaceae bacterium]|nr:septum formation initiator family protein [Microbacteriaceae bacterium]